MTDLEVLEVLAGEAAKSLPGTVAAVKRRKDFGDVQVTFLDAASGFEVSNVFYPLSDLGGDDAQLLARLVADAAANKRPVPERPVPPRERAAQENRATAQPTGTRSSLERGEVIAILKACHNVAGKSPALVSALDKLWEVVE